MPDSYHSVDNENFAVHTGSAPSTIRHIIWQGLPGVYLAASDGGLLKTIDYGEHWDYLRPATIMTGLYTSVTTTWPAGALGRQVAFAIGPKVCPSGSGPIYIGMFSGGTESFVYDPDSDSWSVLGITGDDSLFGFVLVDRIFLISGFNADLFISTTAGAIWTGPLTPPVGATAGYATTGMNHSGILFAIFEVGGVDKIYSSNNDGSSWTLLFTLPAGETFTGNFRWLPSDDNIGVIVETDFTDLFVHVTQDGGVTWPSMTIVNGFTNYTISDFLNSGRLIVSRFDGTVHYTDDYSTINVGGSGLPSGFVDDAISIGNSHYVAFIDSLGNSTVWRGDGATYTDMTNPASPTDEVFALASDGHSLYFRTTDGLGTFRSWKVNNPETTWSPIEITDPSAPDNGQFWRNS